MKKYCDEAYSIGTTSVAVDALSMSCGARELEGLAHFVEFKKDDLLAYFAGFLQNLLESTSKNYNSGVRTPFILFSDLAKKSSGGSILRDLIINNNLGSVLASNVKKNTTGNMIAVWVWEPNWKAVEKFTGKIQENLKEY